mmetsp:Transcript_17842/g.39113  ORF Transcript_17842/g.39113 Transcript_17842/m.39113 type:complete len:182 (+) Transcript_17842:131-676(+)
MTGRQGATSAMLLLLLGFLPISCGRDRNFRTLKGLAQVLDHEALVMTSLSAEVRAELARLQAASPGGDDSAETGPKLPKLAATRPVPYEVSAQGEVSLIDELSEISSPESWVANRGGGARPDVTTSPLMRGQSPTAQRHDQQEHIDAPLNWANPLPPKRTPVPAGTLSPEELRLQAALAST